MHSLARKVGVSDRIHKREGEISDMHLGVFEPEGSGGDRFLRQLSLGASLTRESLVNLAQIFSALSGVPFPRDYTRRRALVVKWFNDHLSTLEPLDGLFTVRIDKLVQKKKGEGGSEDGSLTDDSAYDEDQEGSDYSHSVGHQYIRG
jgi:hypothetical protein